MATVQVEIRSLLTAVARNNRSSVMQGARFAAARCPVAASLIRFSSRYTRIHPAAARLLGRLHLPIVRKLYSLPIVR